jgi:hypothetical protein
MIVDFSMSTPFLLWLLVSLSVIGSKVLSSLYTVESCQEMKIICERAQNCCGLARMPLRLTNAYTFIVKKGVRLNRNCFSFWINEKEAGPAA